MTEMLFVKSKDYWGYDASTYDSSIKFYTRAFTVSESQYSSMDAADQERLNPCALFYVRGVSDNHNFMVVKIAPRGSDGWAVSGLLGAMRQLRDYTIGQAKTYEVGGIGLKADSSASSIAEIITAIEGGTATEGTFEVSGFMTTKEDIANYLEMPKDEKSAEDVPSGSEYLPEDPTVADPSTAPATPESFSAEGDDDYEDYDVVICKSCDLEMDEDQQEEGVRCESCKYLVHEDCLRENPAYDLDLDSDDLGPAEICERCANKVLDRWEVTSAGLPWMEDSEDDDDDEEDFDAEKDENGNYSSCPKCGYEPPVYEVGQKLEDGSVIETEDEAHEETIFWLYENHPDYCPAGWNPDEDFSAEGDSRLRDIRGKFMNRKRAKNAVFGEVMSQQMSGYYRTGIVGDNPPVGQNIARRNPAAKARYFIEPGVQDPNTRKWSKGPNFQQARKIAKGVAWDTVQDMGLAAEGLSMTTLGESEFPVLEDSYGGNTAWESGYGVPQWYGSAENEDIKLSTDQLEWTIISRGKWPMGAEMEYSYEVEASEWGIDWTDEEYESFIEGMLQDILNRAARLHLGAGWHKPADNQKILWNNSYEGRRYEVIGRNGYGPTLRVYGIDESDPWESLRVEVMFHIWNDGTGNIHEAIQVNGNTIYDLMEPYPDVPWGLRDFAAQNITETLEESAPVSLRKPALMAALGLVAGIVYARRK